MLAMAMGESFRRFFEWDISRVDVGVMVGYFVIMIVVGLICRNLSSNVSDYVRMGCKSTWWLMGLSIFMQTISANFFTANCAQAYLAGWSGFLTSLGGVIGLLFQALFFAPLLRRTRAVTPADAIRIRFGPVCEQFFCYAGVFGTMFWAGSFLLGLTSFISPLFGIPVESLVIFVGVIIVFYSVSGGSWSVQITDTLQSFIMVPICLVVAFLAIKAVGGFSGLFEGIQEKGLAADYVLIKEAGHVYTSPVGRVSAGLFTLPWLLASFMNSLTHSANIINCHRYLSTKNDGEARKAALLAAVLMFFGAFVWFLPAMAGRILYEDQVIAIQAPPKVEKVEAAVVAPVDERADGEQEYAVAVSVDLASESADAQAGKSEIAVAAAVASEEPVVDKPESFANLPNAPDGAYAIVAKNVLPPGLIGLVLIAMFAATMSSMDSCLTGTAGLISKNMCMPLFGVLGIPDLKPKSLLMLTKFINLGLGILAIVMSLLMNAFGNDGGLYQIGLNIVLLIALPSVLPWTLAFFMKKLPSWGPLVGVVCGFINSAFQVFASDLFVKLSISIFGHKLMWHERLYLNFAMILIPTAMTVVFWDGSSPAYKKRVDEFFEKMRTPIDFEKEVGVSADHSLLTTVGWLGLFIAAGISVIAFFSTDDQGKYVASSVWAVLFVAGTVGLVSLLMLLSGKAKTREFEAQQQGKVGLAENTEQQD